jgi:YVTN family beta-propeller protein
VIKVKSSSVQFQMLAITSIFLASLGIVHNVFADSIIATIPMPSSTGESTVNPNTNMIYAQGYGNGWIAVIDGSTNSVVSEISLTSDQAGYPLGIAANPITNTIYADDGRGIEVIDGTSNNIIATIPVTCSGNVAVNTNTNEVYVSDHFGSSVCIINGTTNTQIGSISVSTQPWGIGVNADTNKIYVASRGGYEGNQSSVTVINGSTNSVVKTIPASGYAYLVGVNPDTNKIYISTGVVGVTYVINGSADTATRIPLSVGCFGVIPSANKIYACDGNNSNQIDIINGNNDTVTTTIQIASSNTPYLVANPNTDRIYVSSASNNDVIVIQGSLPASTGSPTTSQLQVNSQDSYGNAITGFQTELYAQNGTQIATGYTSYNFTLDDNQNYTVNVENYGKYIFDHWLDTGSTDANRTVSITSNDAITAVYKTVPQPPTSLEATTASSSQINLSWNAPANNGGSAITGYEIQRSTNGGSTWSTIVANTASTATTYSDTGLSPNTTYTYQVSAINPVGAGNPSNAASATTPLLSAVGINVGPVSTPPLQIKP